MHQAPDYLIAEFSPQLPDAVVARRRRLMITSIVSLVLSLVLCGVIGWFNRESLHGPWPWVFFGVILLPSLLRLAFTIVGWRLALADRRKVGQGPALVIGRFGVELEGQRFDWPQVGGITTRNGRWGNGPDVVVVPTSAAPVAVPMNHLDVLPATLDSAARVFSFGRHGVNLSAVED